MQIVLVRHGIAEDAEADSNPADSERQLTKKGCEQMKQVAKGLRRVVGEVDCIATSPYIRAVQTAEILCDEFNKVCRPVLEQVTVLKSGSNAEAIAQWLSLKVPDTTVLLVGHEPDFSILMNHLTNVSVGSYAKLSKAGACLIDYPSLPGVSKGKLIWLATPVMLRWLRG